MSICRATEYTGKELTAVPFRNWANTYRYLIERYFEPASLPELVDVVARASEEARELHAVGSAWAYEPVAASDDWVVSLKGLKQKCPNIVPGALTDEWAARVTSGSDHLVCVEAGISIGELNELLEADGLAMITLGGANGQSLAGAISTSTHGGDLDQPPLSDLVQAIHLVTDGGQEVWIERASTPVTTDARLKAALACQHVRIVRDDSIFNAAVMALGRFGVIYAFVVRVRSVFRLNEWTQRRSRSSILALLRQGVDDGTHLGPLHDDLNQVDVVPAELGQDTTLPPHFTELVFNSQDPERAWVRRRWETAIAEDQYRDAAPNILCDMAAARGLCLAAAAALRLEIGAVLAIPVYGLAMAPLIWTQAIMLESSALDSNLTAGEALARIISACWVCSLGFLVPKLSEMALGGRFSDSAKHGRRGVGHIITTGTREASLDKCYTAGSIEVIFPSTTPAYIDFLATVLDASPAFHQVGYVSMRFCRASEALLSMHNVEGGHAVSIECASISGLDGIDAWLGFIEQIALKLGGRPHWGQVNHLDEPRVIQLYQGKVFEWREALLAVSGTSERFGNAYTRRCGLEPAGIVREVTGTRKTGHGVITHLCGGPDARWDPVPVDLAIVQIEAGTVKYFTRLGDNLTPVLVVDAAAGKYLRSRADGATVDNLDSLPDC